MTVLVTGDGLDLEAVEAVAAGGARVALDPGARERMLRARAVVDDAVARGEEIYGVTTGVGARKQIRLRPDQLTDFNRMLIAEHRTGVGPDAPPEVVRAIVLCLLNYLAKGTTMARPLLADRLVSALNDGEHIRVRMLGSVGAGDLAPTADVAHHLFADVPLEPGEAIPLINSSAFSAGLGALALQGAVRLLDTADLAAALDLEAFAANPSVLEPAIGRLRPYPGLRTALARLASDLEGSFLWTATPRNLQDPLTFRCVPQIHGAARDGVEFARTQVTTELNASQGNPLVIADEARIVSVGNFETAPLAAALDVARIALAPVLTCAVERTVKLLHEPHSGLPPGLATERGLATSALGILGVTAQALGAEARLLATPVSYELVSTSQEDGIEDRTSMAPLAARRLAEMTDLGRRLIAVELAVAAQAVDVRGSRPLGRATRRLHALVRERVPALGPGLTAAPDLEPLADVVLAAASAARAESRGSASRG